MTRINALKVIPSLLIINTYCRVIQGHPDSFEVLQTSIDNNFRSEKGFNVFKRPYFRHIL